MTQAFSGKVVLVAGGTGALGRAVSRAFLEAGATVVVTYRTPLEFDTLVQQSGARAAQLDGERVDVTDEAAAAKLIADLVARHGRVDALVNAVGGYAGGAPLWELDATAFDRMLTMNLRSGYALMRAAIPAMLKQASGAVVNIASKAGVQPEAGGAVYAASKAAALALMTALAAEVTGRGVRVNSVLPSTIDTEANRRAMPGADFAKWASPDDIARVVVFLCSAEAVLIHGAAVPVYGSA